MIKRRSPTPILLTYVAGAYRAPDYEGVRTNIRLAEQWAIALAKKGYMPVTPHMQTAHFELLAPTVSDEFWLAGTMELLRACPAIFLIPENWWCSKGARAEAAEALRLGKNFVGFITAEAATAALSK